MEKSRNLTSGMTPAIAVIILNWNGAKLLPEYLPKVVASTDLALSRIILADNGSTDGSVDYVRSAFTPEQVELMLLDKNYGFAEGYTRAIAAVADRFDYVVLLNSDVATTPGWDHTLFDFMQANPDVAACQPKVLSYTRPDTFEYAGASGGYLDCNGYPYCRGRIFATCERDEGFLLYPSPSPRDV
ncbi:MAG: glycosyltransferase, partial [Muribaculaceae bacterium]|nr:glycosyltransferase [Muribaculaceae bacterium]